MDIPVSPLHDRNLALEAENARLRSRLQSCEQSFALLQAELIELRQQQQTRPEQGASINAFEIISTNRVLKQSLDLLATEPDLDKFVGHVLAAIAHQFQSPLTEYWSQTEDTAYVEQIYWQGNFLDRSAIAQVFPTHVGLTGFKVPLEMIGGVPLCQRQTPVVYDDHSTNPFVKDLDWVIYELIPRNLLKEINVPLFWGDTTIGALTIHLPKEHQFTTWQVDLAQMIAHQVTLAVEMRRLAQEAKQAAVAREREQAALERVVEFAKANTVLRRNLAWLSQEEDLSHFLKQTLLEITVALQADLGHLFVLNQPDRQLELVGRVIDGQLSNQGEPTEPDLFASPFPADITPIFSMMEAQDLILTLDLLSIQPELVPMVWPGCIEWHVQEGRKQLGCLVLKAGDRSVGFLGFGFREYRALTQETRELVLALANQAALAILLFQLAEQSRQAAIAHEWERKKAQERAEELAKINKALTQRENEVQRSYRLLSMVAQVTKNLLENPDVEQAVAQALQVLGEAAGASRVDLIKQQHDAASGRLQHCVLIEWKDPNTLVQDDAPASDIIDNEEIAPIITELHAGRSLCLSLDEYPEAIRPRMAELAIKVTGVAPIFIGGEYFGCLCLDNCIDHRLWSKQEMEVLTTGAGAIGAALLRQRLVDRLIRSQAEQQRAGELAKANDALRRSLNTIAFDADPRQIIAHILRIVGELFDTPLVEYWTHSEDCKTAHLSFTYWQGHLLEPADQPGHPGNANFPCFPCLTCDHNVDRLPYLLIEDITTDYHTQQVTDKIGIDVKSWFTARGVQRLLNIPLWLNEKTIGALDIWLPIDRHFKSSEIELAYTFGQQITLASYLNELVEDTKQTILFEERNRIASDIHDTLAQAFTGISLQLEVAKPLIQQEPETVEQILQHISQLAKNGLDEARQSVWALYPPGAEYANLAQMLYDSIEQISRNTPVSLEVNIEGDPCPLSPYTGMNLLKIGQEALTNALKHSQAQTVVIELTYTSELVVLLIRDDGRGFTPPTNLDNLNGGFGLVGMYERCDRIGALLSILSQPGQGTQILVELPLN